MALSIKTEEADRLARELAAATHESITQAVTVALRERLARVRTLPGPGIVTAARLLAVDYEGARRTTNALTMRSSGTTSMVSLYDVHRCGHLGGDGHRPRRAGR